MYEQFYNFNSVFPTLNQILSIANFSDSEEEEEFAEALDVNVGIVADETLRLAESWTRKHGHKPPNEKDDGKDEDESGSCRDSDDSREHFSYQEYDSEGESSCFSNNFIMYLLQ